MTRAEYTAIGLRTNEQLALLTVVNLADMEKMIAERNRAGTDMLAERQAKVDVIAAKEKEKADALAAEATKLADVKKAAATALAEKDAALAAKEKERLAEAKKVADAQALIDAMGGTPLALELKKEAEIARLTAAKKAAEDALAKLKP